MTGGPREWDAEEYDNLARPQDSWGLRILGLLSLEGDETVLEAGCGTGRDTARLLARLPNGRVFALDGSARMLDLARSRLAGSLERVELVHSDLRRPLELPSPVDVVFSVAAFHWIPDHLGLFRNLASVLRPGGLLVADCGGRGNIAQVSAAIEQVTGVPGEEGVWNFAGPEETRLRLETAGFENIEVLLHGEPAEFESDREFRRFLKSVILGSHLAGMPASEQADFVESVASRLPGRSVDYVRLTISARRKT